MQTDDIKPNLSHQIKEFIAYTADTDNDTIVAQYTLIKGLVAQLAPNHRPEFDSDKPGFEAGNNADYDYFLNVNTISPQPPERKQYALEGLQEGVRRLFSQLREDL